MERLCTEGVSVTFTDMSDDGIATQEECVARNWPVQLVARRLADENFCRQAVAAAVAKWGGVDYLVNNAFSFIAKGADATRDDWNRMMQVGPIGYATIGQLAAEAMRTAVRARKILEYLEHFRATSLGPNRSDIQCGKRGRESVDPLHGFGPRTPRYPRQRAQSRLDLDAQVDEARGGDRAEWGPDTGANTTSCGDWASVEGDGRARRFPVERRSQLCHPGSGTDGRTGGYGALGSEGLGTSSTFAGSD